MKYCVVDDLGVGRTCNASSYAAFAIHAASGSDQRFGARDTRL
jgi:hypothetical protein